MNITLRQAFIMDEMFHIEENNDIFLVVGDTSVYFNFIYGKFHTKNAAMTYMRKLNHEKEYAHHDYTLNKPTRDQIYSEIFNNSNR